MWLYCDGGGGSCCDGNGNGGECGCGLRDGVSRGMVIELNLRMVVMVMIFVVMVASSMVMEGLQWW